MSITALAELLQLATARRKREWFAASFILSAVAVLGVTGIAKVLSAEGRSRALAVPDPITGFQFGYLMLIVGFLELCIAVVCFRSRSRKLSLALIAWLATNFVLFRVGLWSLGWHKPCGCLGTLTDALHISPTTADHIMKAVLAYLLVGSYWLLWRQWKHSNLAPAERTGLEKIPLGL